MSDHPGTVLVIEDEPQIRRFLRATLGHEGYTLIEAVNGTTGVQEAASHPPDVVLLDLGLPDIDGLEVIRQLRTWSAVPVIVLSARGQEQDKVAALDSGANDYLTKPFSAPELMARIRVALREAARISGETHESIFKTGALTIDLVRRIVTLQGKEVRLTPIEFRLLVAFVKHAGRVLTHHQLLREVWGPVTADEGNYLRVYVHQLRQKIEEDPARPKYLLTETGVGYRLRTDS